MNIYLIAAGILFLYMNGWFVVGLLRKRNDVADIAWGLGFILMAWLSFALAGGASGVRGIILGGLVSIWGLRLARHIYRRNRGKPEDYRYAAWRASWGRWFHLRAYAQIYLLQGALLFLIVAPVLATNVRAANAFSWLDALGLAVWLIGFVFESVGDAQLARFVRDPANKGKLIQSGLWQYTRHPNYFGEVTLWWGVWIIALAAASPWWTIIGPLTITVLLLKVSGVPMLERKMALNPDFADYARRVSVFFPLPPKR